MHVFTAVILVCHLSTPVPACDEMTAVDVISTQAPNELICTHGAQEIVARGALREGVGDTLYVKSICRKD